MRFPGAGLGNSALGVGFRPSYSSDQDGDDDDDDTCCPTSTTKLLHFSRGASGR